MRDPIISKEMRSELVDSVRESRGRNGYHNMDAYNLNEYLTWIIVQAIEVLIEQGSSVPPGLDKEEWDEILDKIRKGFLAHRARGSADSDEEEAELNSRWEEGSQLFIEWFADLWD